MNTMIKNNKIQIMTSEVELKMVEELCEKLGCNKSELIRGLLREKHTKMFPAYTPQARAQAIERIPEEELTAEQICEKAGGTIVTRDGVKMCALQPKNKAYTSYLPMSEPSLIKTRAEQFKNS